MHSDDQINRTLIGAMMAEHRGQPDLATALVAQAAALHLDRYGDRSHPFPPLGLTANHPSAA